jgi:exopolysaccharide biosynthesis polyprenyl glycosylphosphotransferase
VRNFLRYIRRQGYNFRHVLVVGRNSRAAKFLNTVAESPELGLRVVGVVDAPAKKQIDSPFCRYAFLGELTALETVLRTRVVDEMFVFLPIKSFYEDIEAVLRLCESVGVEVKLPTNFFSLKLAKSTISMYGDLSVLDLYTSPKMSGQLIVKRLIDVTTSAVLLLLLSPVFASVSILIKVTSSGPVFFRQQRLGYNGRLFDCLKFRTMVENAEELKKTLLHLNEVSGPVFKIKNDPRVTRIGRVLRKTSIDELPQLINVLNGDMSLVGPRPPVPSEVIQYDLPHLRRLSMKPGITCLWQVTGRSMVAFDKWMELDKQYIDHWSLWLDLKILAKTVPAVLKGSGAA